MKYPDESGEIFKTKRAVSNVFKTNEKGSVYKEKPELGNSPETVLP